MITGSAATGRIMRVGWPRRLAAAAGLVALVAAGCGTHQATTTAAYHVPHMATVDTPDWAGGAITTPDTVVVAAPPAGGELNVTFANAGRLVAAYVNFTASAGVGNRLIFFQIQDANNHIVYRVEMPTALTASQVGEFSLTPAVPLSSTSDGTNAYTFLVPIPPDLIVGAGWKLVSGASFEDPADQWSAAILTMSAT